MAKTFIDDADLLPLALEWYRAGRSVAVATVVETWGSAPRGVGSLLIIDGDGAMQGSVSGGCVEGAVITEALDALEDGKPRLLTYGVSDDDAFAVGLACGGEIRVLVEPVGGAMPVNLLEEIVNARQSARPVAYVVNLNSSERGLADVKDYQNRFNLDQSGIEEDGETFVSIHNPPLRLIIIGAVHIAQPLVQMARSCGFAPTVIDPRSSFGAVERFRGETVIDDWPDEALANLRPDNRTAVVTLTHDPKLDDPAIIATLNSDAFYLGCLGSKRTHAKRIERLIGAGLSEDQLARIHGPVGLNLGGRKPAEIAVSIMAEIISTLRGTK